VQLLSLEFNGYPPDYYENTPRQVSGVQRPDIQRVAMQYLRPDAITILVVGDARSSRRVWRASGRCTASRRRPPLR